MNTIPVLHAECFKTKPSIISGISTRLGGVSPAPLGMNLSFSVGDAEKNVKRNRELFFSNLNISPEELAIPGQVHGKEVKIVDSPGSYPGCDGLLTGTCRLFLCVSVADCVPVFLFDEQKNVVAAIHAGWRGTVNGIVAHTLQIMKTEFRSDLSKIIAFIGPSAGTCCYNVGDDVASQFDARFVSRRKGSDFVDLKSANVAQLVEAGVSRTSIEVSPLCTITEKDLLHSFRRDGKRSGRMMGVIGLA